jgi:hypothetical protein
MSVLSDTFDQNGRELKTRSATTGPAVDADWALLARCLTLGSPNHTPVFEKAIRQALAFGATPFEVIAGTPAACYGARITFRLPQSKHPILAEFGLADHPWGDPEWIGLRVTVDGELIAKAYHARVKPCHLRRHLEPLRPFLYPVMASLHRGIREDYFRCHSLLNWSEFVTTSAGSLGTFATHFEPEPQPVMSAFCVSTGVQGESLRVITVFADHRSLPDDESIRTLWTKDMSASDAEAYELALAGVRSCGARRFGSWHAMLSWTLERDGSCHKAASLRFPSLEQEEQTNAVAG